MDSKQPKINPYDLNSVAKVRAQEQHPQPPSKSGTKLYDLSSRPTPPKK